MREMNERVVRRSPATSADEPAPSTRRSPTPDQQRRRGDGPSRACEAESLIGSDGPDSCSAIWRHGTRRSAPHRGALDGGGNGTSAEQEAIVHPCSQLSNPNGNVVWQNVNTDTLNSGTPMDVRRRIETPSRRCQPSFIANGTFYFDDSISHQETAASANNASPTLWVIRKNEIGPHIVVHSR